MNGRKKTTWIILVILFAGKNILYGIMADTFDLDLYTLQVITFGNPRNTNADLFNLLIDLFPVFICEFLFGLTIYRHFCTGAVYYFCRQENRLHWFASEIRSLAAAILFFSISWFGISWIGGGTDCRQDHRHIHLPAVGSICFICIVSLPLVCYYEPV